MAQSKRSASAVLDFLSGTQTRWYAVLLRWSARPMYVLYNIGRTESHTDPKTRLHVLAVTFNVAGAVLVYEPLRFR